VGILSERGEDAKIIAGGQSLIPLLKLRLASPALLVDINRIKGLDHIFESDRVLRIGALVRMADVEASRLLEKRYPIIHDAAAVIADPLVRNLGTVGGNVSHADPANDLPAVMLALGAEFVATGPSGGRTIRADGFFRDTFATALAHDEILTEVRVPRPSPRSGGAYLKHEQKVADFATAGVALQLSLDTRGEIENIGIGLTAVGPTAVKVNNAEEAVKGRKPSDREAADILARLASGASDPASDIRGTAAYKRRLVGMLVRRALQVASERARKGGSG
jgi:carbon-monoxide dehydrogenase medium subunit